jgi:hypothetical protein
MPAHITYNKEALAKGCHAVALELNVNVWDYLPGIDTSKSYEAFMCYRDMGIRRTFEKVAIAFKKSIKSYSQQMNDWSTKSFWQERLREYDRYIELEKRKHAEALEISSHIDKLQRYRERSEILGWSNLDVSQKCLDIAKKVLENYENNPDLLENMRSQDLRNIVAAGNACGEQSLRNLNEALDVARLLETLDNTITVNSEEITDITTLTDINYG